MFVDEFCRIIRCEIAVLLDMRSETVRVLLSSKKTNMTSFISVTISFPNEAEALKIARLLVEQKLIACAQLLPIQSIYNWKGELQNEKEVLLQAKTTEAKLSKIEEVVVAAHTYDVPEIIATPIIFGHQPYLDWINENTTSTD